METLKQHARALAAPVARNLLRILGGGLVALGGYAGVEVVPAFVDDPVIQQHATEAVGAVLIAVAEGFYALARKHGWAK